MFELPIYPTVRLQISEEMFLWLMGDMCDVNDVEIIMLSAYKEFIPHPVSYCSLYICAN